MTELLSQTQVCYFL